MALEINQLAIKDRGHFIHAIGKQEGSVKDRNLGFGFWHELAVNINSTHGNFPDTMADD